MYKNKAKNNRNNLSGTQIARLRKNLHPKVSQRTLAEKLQIIGLDIDKNAVQRIESGQRFVTDIELRAFALALDVSADILLSD